MNGSVPTVLQSWDAYVDFFHEDGRIELVMVDTTVDRGDEKEIGTFPPKLLEHLSPKRGQLVTVEVMSDRTVRITDTVISDEQRRQDRSDIEELLRNLELLRDD
jgi:antitoxin component of MazEF toxin-antitoxin module